MTHKNLYLIGYRGAGKSSVARELAEILEWEMASSDQIIVQSTGKTIAEIFSESGEEYFRDLESAVVEELSQRTKTIVDLGGGAVIRPQNRERITKSGIVVWLRAAPEVLWQRIASDPVSSAQRPQLSNSSGLEEVRKILEARHSIYADCAEHTIDTDRLSPQEIAQEVVCYMETGR